MAILNFKCKKCKRIFDFEIGKITFGNRLSFEKEIYCNNCGKREIDDLILTEEGQTMVTELYFEENKCTLKNERLH